MTDQYELKPGEVLRVTDPETHDVIQTLRNTGDRPMLVHAVPNILDNVKVGFEYVGGIREVREPIPVIVDDDEGTISIRMGKVLKSWTYADRSEQKHKMSLAWAWMDGYSCLKRQITQPAPELTVVDMKE